MGLLEVAKSGDQRATLEALRDELASALVDADPNVKPQVAAQLRATLADLRALPGGVPARVDGVVSLDEAKQRRVNRRQSGAEAVSGA